MDRPTALSESLKSLDVTNELCAESLFSIKSQRGSLYDGRLPSRRKQQGSDDEDTDDIYKPGGTAPEHFIGSNYRSSSYRCALESKLEHLRHLRENRSKEDVDGADAWWESSGRILQALELAEETVRRLKLEKDRLQTELANVLQEVQIASNMHKSDETHITALRMQQERSMNEKISLQKFCRGLESALQTIEHDGNVGWIRQQRQQETEDDETEANNALGYVMPKLEALMPVISTTENSSLFSLVRLGSDDNDPIVRTCQCCLALVKAVIDRQRAANHDPSLLKFEEPTFFEKLSPSLRSVTPTETGPLEAALRKRVTQLQQTLSDERVRMTVELSVLRDSMALANNEHYDVITGLRAELAKVTSENRRLDVELKMEKGLLDKVNRGNVHISDLVGKCSEQLRNNRLHKIVCRGNASEKCACDSSVVGNVVDILRQTCETLKTSVDDSSILSISISDLLFQMIENRYNVSDADVNTAASEAVVSQIVESEQRANNAIALLKEVRDSEALANAEITEWLSLENEFTALYARLRLTSIDELNLDGAGEDVETLDENGRTVVRSVRYSEMGLPELLAVSNKRVDAFVSDVTPLLEMVNASSGSTSGNDSGSRSPLRRLSASNRGRLRLRAAELALLLENATFRWKINHYMDRVSTMSVVVSERARRDASENSTSIFKNISF